MAIKNLTVFEFMFSFLEGIHAKLKKWKFRNKKKKQKMASKKLARKKVGKIEKKMQKVGSQK